MDPNKSPELPDNSPQDPSLSSRIKDFGRKHWWKGCVVLIFSGTGVIGVNNWPEADAPTIPAPNSMGNTRSFTLDLADTYVDDTHRVITAITNRDVDFTPYYIEIFNQTTGREILRCNEGTECQATIPPYSDPSTTYIAYVATFSTVMPPHDIQATSRELTVGPHPA